MVTFLCLQSRSMLALPQALQVSSCPLKGKVLHFGADLVMGQQYACVHIPHNEKEMPV